MVRLGSVIQNLHHASSAVRTSSNVAVLKKHSGLEIAGVFILIAVLAVVAANIRASSQKAVSHNSSQTSQTLKLQSSSNNSTPPAADSLAPSSSSHSVSTQVSSGNNGSSTSVTVNGQPVGVPANGSTHQTIGNAQVDVSHSESSDGTASNTSVTSTDYSVGSSSDVSTETGGN